MLPTLLVLLTACTPDYSLSPEEDAKGGGDETGIPEDTYDSEHTDTAKPGDTEEPNVEGEPIADASRRTVERTLNLSSRKHPPHLGGPW